MAQPVGTARVRMTYEDFLRSDYVHAEWVDGEVFELSPASRRHQRLAIFLGPLLQHFVEAHRLGEVLLDFQMKTRAGREPDILYVSSAHLDRFKENHLAGPADLVVEIVSPDSVRRDREVKLREYQEGGVPEYWLIDPLRQEALFHTLGADGIYHLIPVGQDGIFRSLVLPGLWLKIEWLWQEPLPALLDVLKAWGLAK